MINEINFKELWQCWNKFGNGLKAEIRRAQNLKTLTEIPAFYRLTRGQSAECWQRIVFCLPWAVHRDGAKSLGATLSSAGLSEKRLFQMIRSTSPNDIVHLRRLLQHVQPAVDWSHLGPLLFWWGDENKRRLLEDFYRMPRDGQDKADA